MVGKFFKSQGGVSGIEFAFIAPILMLLMAGIVEFGRAYLAYSAVNRLATRYAFAWADCSDAPTGTCGIELALYTSPATMQNIVPQLTNTIGLRMFEVTMTGATANTLYAYPVGTTPNASELTIAQSAIASGQTGVVVTVNYTYVFTFFPTYVAGPLGASRNLTYTIAQLKS